eukprot:TRINITY_DN4197_c0_g1_i5.p1 TRINITY_DN4197_c0_g1~~TRINITY_DN4197_c0_g1_i5.p1  ORF type:complete len:361 (+),score=133.17 TRINITY_DN4197_c0_g1_i5:115-1197(+)
MSPVVLRKLLPGVLLACNALVQAEVEFRGDGQGPADRTMDFPDKGMQDSVQGGMEGDAMPGPDGGGPPVRVPFGEGSQAGASQLKLLEGSVSKLEFMMKVIEEAAFPECSDKTTAQACSLDPHKCDWVPEGGFGPDGKLSDCNKTDASGAGEVVAVGQEADEEAGKGKDDTGKDGKGKDAKDSKSSKNSLLQNTPGDDPVAGTPADDLAGQDMQPPVMEGAAGGMNPMGGADDPELSMKDQMFKHKIAKLADSFGDTAQKFGGMFVGQAVGDAKPDDHTSTEFFFIADSGPEANGAALSSRMPKLAATGKCVKKPTPTEDSGKDGKDGKGKDGKDGKGKGKDEAKTKGGDAKNDDKKHKE